MKKIYGGLCVAALVGLGFVIASSPANAMGCCAGMMGMMMKNEASGMAHGADTAAMKEHQMTTDTGMAACPMNMMSDTAAKTDTMTAKSPVKSKAAPKAEAYSCPMHPEVVSKRPGNCPKCGMRLTKFSTKTGGKSR